MNQLIEMYSGIHKVTSGKQVEVIQPVNLYECQLDDDVFVGPFCEIQKGVHVGARTRIQSHSFICEGVTIGHDCFIGHGVMFINDKFSTGAPAQGNESLLEKTNIGNHVSIGSNATILPIEICDNVVIGAGSVVTKSIKEPGKYAGNPAIKIAE